MLTDEGLAELSDALHAQWELLRRWLDRSGRGGARLRD